MDTASEYEKVFIELITNKLPNLHRISQKLVSSQQDAKDIVQQAIYKAWNKLKSFNGNSSVYTWIVKIVINESLCFLREKKRETSILKEMAIMAEVLNESKTKQDDLIDDMLLKIEKLPDIYREAICQVYILGDSPQMAAKILNCSEDTFYQRLSKARKLLLKMHSDS